MTKSEEYRNMIYCLHMNARDKRRKEDVRVVLAEVAQCLKDCNNERLQYKKELDDLKKCLKKIVDSTLTID